MQIQRWYVTQQFNLKLDAFWMEIYTNYKPFAHIKARLSHLVVFAPGFFPSFKVKGQSAIHF